MDRKVSLYRQNEQLLANIKLADTFGGRCRGLMFYQAMPGVAGIILYPCNFVHLFWMRFPLDLVYINRNREVLLIRENISPNRIGPYIKDAYFVLETEAGSLAGKNIRKGEQLWWK